MSHIKDIHHGKAIVPYAPYTCAPALEWPDYITFDPGWVLPGGQRIQSEVIARWMAQAMAEVIG